jgi:predicted DsbA family dithiol-disulfide isomerase
LKDYGNDVRVVYKHFVVHPQVATTPALAACAAHKQGKFTEMEHLIWEKGFKANRNLSKENMVTLAKEAGLNMDQFQKDMDGQECAQTIRKDQAELSRVGTSGTPAFYINGRFLSGARPIDQFKVLVDEELKKANDRIGKGEATVADYYDKFVLQQGKKQLDMGAQAEKVPPPGR